MALLTLGQQVETVRCPELPHFSAYGPLTTSDYTFWWLAAFNKTVKVDAQSLYTFFQTGGGGSYPPVVLGADIIYIVDDAEAGGQIAPIPALAGKNFFLERSGQPLTLDEFEILNAGGFKLIKTGDLLVKDERFHLHVYELAGGSTSGSSGKPFITGEVQISANTSFDTVNHVNKLIQLRGGTSKITLTLPLVDDIPDYTIIPIEASINNSAEQRITTQGGQSIYINGTAVNDLYLRLGEVVWLYRADDGYYIINDFGRNYKTIGNIEQAYKAGVNQLVCKGQELNRADYPRLWSWVQTVGQALVSDADWNMALVYRQGTTWSTTPPPTGEYITVANPLKGCFSQGNGTTTFRLPDLRGSVLRGLVAETGTDTNRYRNVAGSFQGNQVGPFYAAFRIKSRDFSNAPGTTGPDLTGPDGGATDGRDMGSNFSTLFNETVMDNVGILHVINC